MDRMILKFVNFLMLCIMFLIVACQSQPNNAPTVKTDSVQTATFPISDEKELCFRRVSGNQHRDTLELSLHISGKKIEGTLRQSIFEKDQRLGTLSGESDGRFIRADWIYVQEGIRDTFPVHFTIAPDAVLMEPITEGVRAGGLLSHTDTENWINIPRIICYQR